MYLFLDSYLKVNVVVYTYFFFSAIYEDTVTTCVMKMGNGKVGQIAN